MAHKCHPTPGNKWLQLQKCTTADVWLRTPNDGQKGCPKHVVIMPIKLEFSASVGFIHKELQNVLLIIIGAYDLILGP